jgi:hypothetical protein
MSDRKVDVWVDGCGETTHKMFPSSERSGSGVCARTSRIISSLHSLDLAFSANGSRESGSRLYAEPASETPVCVIRSGFRDATYEMAIEADSTAKRGQHKFEERHLDD